MDSDGSSLGKRAFLLAVDSANVYLYCGDSGTHPKSDVAVAACYISTGPVRTSAHVTRTAEQVIHLMAAIHPQSLIFRV